MRRHIAILLAYLMLGLLLTWPMAAHLTTHVPGDGIDDPSLAWNLWWVKHSLVDQPQNPFACDWQFWPIGINLAFYTLTILNGLLSVPLQTALGLVPAYNLLLLSSFVLGGFGAYLLALEFLRPNGRGWRTTLAAFAGGALYAFASAKLFYAALGQAHKRQLPCRGARFTHDPLCILKLLRRDLVAAGPGMLRGDNQDQLVRIDRPIFQSFALGRQAENRELSLLG